MADLDLELSLVDIGGSYLPKSSTGEKCQLEGREIRLITQSLFQRHLFSLKRGGAPRLRDCFAVCANVLRVKGAKANER